MIFWFFPLPLRPNFLQFWLKPILVFPPCFMSLDMFQCLPVYSRWELQYVSYSCEKTVYILIILKKKKSLFLEGPSLVPPSPPLYFSSSLASLSRGSCSFSTPLSTLQLVVVMLLTQSCLTLCDPTDCSPPDSSVHGILQARILKWVAMPSSRGSSRPRDGTSVSCFAGRLGFSPPTLT